MCVCLPCVYLVAVEVKRGHPISWNRSPRLCKPLYLSWEWNTGPLQEQSMLLTSTISPVYICNSYGSILRLNWLPLKINSDSHYNFFFLRKLLQLFLYSVTVYTFVVIAVLQPWGHQSSQSGVHSQSSTVSLTLKSQTSTVRAALCLCLHQS